MLICVSKSATDHFPRSNVAREMLYCCKYIVYHTNMNCGLHNFVSLKVSWYVDWRFLKQPRWPSVMFRQCFLWWLSNECLGVSNHRPFHCLFNSLRGPTSKGHQTSYVFCLLRWKNHWWIPSQRANNAEKITVSWRILRSLTEYTLQLARSTGLMA